MSEPEPAPAHPSVPGLGPTQASEPSGPARSRGRAIGVALISAAVLASSLVLDRLVGPRASASGAPSGGRSGAWFCPHGGSPGWQGWVAVANPGARAVRVRVTSIDERGARPGRVFAVPPSSQVVRPLAADDPAATTEVEYFGGWVGAATVVASGGAGGAGRGVTAQACQSAPHRTWYLPDEPTPAGTEARLVVMNPFAQAATFNVYLRTEGRSVRPGFLSPFVLQPFTSVGVDVGASLLLRQGESTLVAQVVTRLGRVIAGSVVASPDGLRSAPGIDAPATKWVLPLPGGVEPSALPAFVPGASGADLTIIGQGARSQRFASATGGLALKPQQVLTLEATGVPGGGTLVQSTNGRPVVLAIVDAGPQGDPETLVGTPEGRRRWIVMPSSYPAGGGQSFLVLENPGGQDAVVSLTLLGPNGPVAGAATDAVTVPGGRTIRVPIQAGPRGVPLAAVVTASGGTIVPASVSYSIGGRGFAATLGLPMISG